MDTSLTAACSKWCSSVKRVNCPVAVCCWRSFDDVVDDVEEYFWSLRRELMVRLVVVSRFACLRRLILYLIQHIRQTDEDMKTRKAARMPARRKRFCSACNHDEELEMKFDLLNEEISWI